MKSILTDDKEDICYLCETGSEFLDVHHIFGGPVRKTSDKYGLIVHLCRDCHRYIHDKGGNMMNYLHKKGQMAYEQQIGDRDQFINEFIRSYL